MLANPGSRLLMFRFFRTVRRELLDHIRLKNGFTLLFYMMRAINARFVEMRVIATSLIGQIDQELEGRIE